MSLISFDFFIFLIIVFVIYWMSPKSKRWAVLLVASYIFLLSYGKKSVAYLLLSTVCSYLGASYIEKQGNGNPKKKRIALILCLTLNLGLMMALRQGILFTNWIVNRLPEALHILSIKLLIVPLGISYYTLKLVGYLINVYYGRVKSSDHIGKFALYVVFFPELLQGPIEPYQSIYKQFEEMQQIDSQTFYMALYRILWGTIKKVVIATRISGLTYVAFSANAELSGYQILLGAMLYSMQLYADFSGYMDIIHGVAGLFGIKIAQNFNQPYFSESIEMFWHRWHMTMGGWFREYIFYPVSTSKPMKRFGRKCRNILGNTQGKKIPIYVAIFLTWLATGIWHGGTGNWIVWGLLNGLFILIGIQFREFNNALYAKWNIDQSATVLRVWRVLRTFTLVSFLRIFSYSDNLKNACGMIKAMFTRFFESPTFHYWEMTGFWMAIIGCLTLIIGDVVEVNPRLRDKIIHFPYIIRWVFAYIGIILIIMFQGKSTDFLYAQF